MNWLTTMAKPLIKKILKSQLSRPGTKKLLIDLINERVNVPKLEEQEEAILFGQIYDALVVSLDKIVERI